MASWTLNTNDLDFFWGAVYPRIIGRIWQYNVPESALRDYEYVKVRGQRKAREAKREVREAKTKGQFKKLILHDLALFRASTRSEPGSVYDQNAPGNVFDRLIAAFEAMEVNRIWGYNFEFIISDKGIDLPLVEKPGEKRVHAIFRNYRDRPVATPSVNLPMMRDDVQALNVGPFSADAPCLFHEATEPKRSRADEDDDGLTIESFVPAMMKEQGRGWQLRSGLYASLMGAVPRVIAEIWHDEELNSFPCLPPPLPSPRFPSRGQGRRGPRPGMRPKPEAQDEAERKGLRSQLVGEENSELAGDYFSAYLERYGPLAGSNFKIYLHTLENTEEAEETGNTYLTPDKGLTILVPCPPPRADIFEQIATGQAGNPMFTNTTNCYG